MSNSTPKLEKSTVGRLGLVAVAACFIVAVTLNSTLLSGIRLDLTENHLYTLSDGTLNILGHIDEPINLYFFFSDRASGEIPLIRTYAGRVRDMLDEFAQHADGKLRVTEIDPLPFSEDEDRAAGFGLQPVSLTGGGDPLYLGIAGTNSIADEETIAFLDPNRETFLEYDLARLVDTLARPQRPIIGLISNLSMGGDLDPRTGRGTDPWIVRTQLDQLFDVRELDSSDANINTDIAVLMVVHPKTLSDATLYAIDQFILRGGHALLLVDPHAEVDIPPQDPNNPAAAMMASRSSDLNKLFGAWGIRVATDQFIADDRFALAVTGPGNQSVRHLGLIGIDPTGISADDIITGEMRSLNFGYAGAIEVDEAASAAVTALVESSDLATVLPTDGLAFMRDPGSLRDNFTTTGERYVIAARIAGVVPSAFPDGSPLGPDAKDHGEHLAAAIQSINVIVITDVDFLTDRLWAQVQDFFGQRVATAFADNGTLVSNALDNLTGSADLISVRSRASFARPFTRVQELRREAEERYRETQQRLEQELSVTESKLSDLQANREDSSAMILSAEQEAELERFQQERLRIRKELRQVQRELDQRIEDLGTWLKIINIGLIPLAITLFSIMSIFVRRGRSSKMATERAG